MNNDPKVIAHTLNRLAARVMAIEAGLQAVLECLPAKARKETAAALRRRAASAMQSNAQGMSQDMDASMALATAALLEAAGEPPKR